MLDHATLKYMYTTTMRCVTPVLTSTNCWPPHECQLLFVVNPHSLLAYMCYLFSLFQYYTVFFYVIPCGGRKTREAGDKSSEQDVDKARWFNSAQQGENQEYTVPHTAPGQNWTQATYCIKCTGAGSQALSPPPHPCSSKQHCHKISHTCNLYKHTCCLNAWISSNDLLLLTAKTQRKPSPVLIYWSLMALIW